jgi:hypothetical protein
VSHVTRVTAAHQKLPRKLKGLALDEGEEQVVLGTLDAAP